MQYALESREVELSVRELAEFRSGPGADGMRAARWRAEVGQQWHDTLRSRESENHPEAKFEISLKGTVHYRSWQFHLQGRIDQILPGEAGSLLREIKTVRFELPTDPPILRDRYPSYFLQTALYQHLWNKADKGTLTGSELLFIDIESGITQRVPLDRNDSPALESQLEAFYQWLEFKRSSLMRLREADVARPFAEWRPGQEESRQALGEAVNSHSFTLFEAPTGFGKTGLILEQALRQIQAGNVERILYLTGKTTGHLPVREQLERMLPETGLLRHYALRSRADHAIAEHFLEATNPHDAWQRWQSSGISITELFQNGTVPLAKVRELGESLGIEPYALSRMFLPYAEIWIGDYNYVFAPDIAEVFSQQPGFQPEKTFLIIDEAHNLPDRVASAWSGTLNHNSVESVFAEVQFSRFPQALAKALDWLSGTLRTLGPTNELDGHLLDKLEDQLTEVAEAWKESVFFADELSPTSLEWLWNIEATRRCLQRTDLFWHYWVPRPGQVEFRCLDAAPEIVAAIEPFYHTVFMSATLAPETSIKRVLGLEDRFVPFVTGRAAWLDEAFDIAVDARVDTRLRQRERFLHVTVNSITQWTSVISDCLVVFFPSYRYAEQVLEVLQFHAPTLHCMLQPRGLPLEEQEQFMDDALASAQVLLLVLGSRFSEGIDTLGGRIHNAMVVGPALPEVNPVQEAKMAQMPGVTRSGAFFHVYQVPGMRKISQALGRLVRAPEHRARILLQGRRFTEESYLQLLPYHCQPNSFINSDDDFQNWLQS